MLYYNWESVPLTLNLREASVLLQKTEDNLRKMAQRGKFPAYKNGEFWRVDKADLMQWVQEQKQKNPYFSVTACET